MGRKIVELKVNKGEKLKWDIFDHNFSMLKVWLQNCANEWQGGWEAKITLYNVYKMVAYLELTRKNIDDVLIEFMAKVINDDKDIK